MWSDDTELPGLTLGGDSQGSLWWRPVVAASGKILVPISIAGVALVIADVMSMAPLIGLGALFVALFGLVGVAQAMFWRWRFGTVNYELLGDGLVVSNGDSRLHSWTRQEVDQLRVEGGVTWWTLITNAYEFPRLVVRSNGQVTRCPPVLVWGTDAGDAFNAAAQSWMRQP